MFAFGQCFGGPNMLQGPKMVNEHPKSLGKDCRSRKVQKNKWVTAHSLAFLSSALYKP
jgi:hypothetical protein